MKVTLRTEAVADLNASAGASSTVKAPADGFVYTNQIIGFLEEAIAAGGFSSTSPVVSLQINSVEVATWTPTAAQLTAGMAIGDALVFTPATADLVDGATKVTAGQTIVLYLKTQGVGGTVTGTVRAWIPCEFAL